MHQAGESDLTEHERLFGTGTFKLIFSGTSFTVHDDGPSHTGTGFALFALADVYYAVPD